MSTIRANTFLDGAGGNTATVNGVTPALSSQAQAEAGPDNATQMTPLRAAQAITARVSGATAGLAYGAIGTYAFLGTATTVAGSTTLANPGDTIAGSSLRALGMYAWTAAGGAISASSPSGTWRVMGIMRNQAVSNAYEVGTLCLRIS